MRKLVSMLLLLLCVVGLAAQSATAAAFDPVFKVTKISGECVVKPPRASNFVPAEEGKTYSYGTMLRTGRNSSAVILFSEGNLCRVLANAVLTVEENSKNRKLKRIALDEGKVDITLQEDFHKTNGLEVETATAICGAIGCDFSVGVKTDADLKLVGIIVKKGEVKVDSEHFNIGSLKDGDILSIVTSGEKNYVRLKNMKGKYVVELKGADGSPKSVELEEGAVIKIVITKTEDEDKFILTILIVAPNGKDIIENWTTTVTIPKGQLALLELLGLPTTTTSTTTVSTTSTSTTIPSPTPVGDR